MPRALNLLRHSISRRPDFEIGLKAAGFTVVERLNSPRPDDLVLCWNRSGGVHETAQVFEAAGANVLISENGYLGKNWLGSEWFSLAKNHHAGAGVWPRGGSGRWDSFGVDPAPWREGGSEVLVLAQRSIGEPDIRSPYDWADTVRRMTRGRVRQHPGTDQFSTPLEADLRNARCVMTWNSGAALKALVLGVPVFYGFHAWIGAEAALPLSDWKSEPKRCDAARLSMFRRLAWAQWTIEEIRSGEAFRTVLAVNE